MDGTQLKPAEQQEMLARMTNIFHALSHETRLTICLTLIGRELSVTQICTELNLPQHKVSQQLALLRSALVLNTRKQSRQVFYSISDRLVTDILKMIRSEGQRTGIARAFEASRFSEIL